MMRDLIKRLERLEGAVAPENCIERTVIQLVGAKDGHPLPWNPTRAYAYRRRREQPDDEILRQTGEPIEAFEARAAAYFAGDYIIG